MLLGFNTNFRYRGVLFHVQTEDSGIGNPHVITHLFHGGNIIASEKRDYSDLLETDDSEGAIKKLMEGQHKSMLKRLSRGEHDHTIGERLGSDVFRDDTDTQSGDHPNVTEEEPPPNGVESVSAAMAEPTVFTPDVPDPAGSTSGDPSEKASERTASALSRVFGDRIVSEKPLDEVVLDYLVENARKRKRNPK